VSKGVLAPKDDEVVIFEDEERKLCMKRVLWKLLFKFFHLARENPTKVLKAYICSFIPAGFLLFAVFPIGRYGRFGHIMHYTLALIFFAMHAPIAWVTNYDGKLQKAIAACFGLLGGTINILALSKLLMLWKMKCRSPGRALSWLVREVDSGHIRQTYPDMPRFLIKMHDVGAWGVTAAEHLFMLGISFGFDPNMPLKRRFSLDG